MDINSDGKQESTISEIVPIARKTNKHVYLHS